jgi:hypothetical protein
MGGNQEDYYGLEVGVYLSIHSVAHSFVDYFVEEVGKNTRLTYYWGVQLVTSK